MKNRKLLLIVSIVLALTMSLGGTLAYLTDTDDAVNVMTLGNVDIEQWENGKVDGFEQGQPLYPAYYEGDDWTAQDIKGDIKKEINVKNVGSSEAYIRTLFAIEKGDLTTEEFDDFIHLEWGVSDFEWVTDIDIDGAKYKVAVYTYPDAVKAGEDAGVTLKRVVMDKEANNDIVSKLGNTYEILVLSQACQTNNFEDLYTEDGAKGVLDEVFGKVEDRAEDWFEEIYNNGGLPTNVVRNVTELKDALEKGGNVIFGNDIEANEVFAISKDVNINMNGYKLTGAVEVKAGVKATITNGTIENTNPDVSGIVSFGDVVLNDVKASSARHTVYIQGNGTAVINGGTYKPYYVRKMTQQTLYVKDNAVVTINGGTFYGPRGTGADSGSAVNVNSANATVYIKGGSFSKGLNDTLSNKGTLDITGGTFDKDPSSFVNEKRASVAKNDDGTWTVTPVPPTVVSDPKDLQDSLNNGEDVKFDDDMEVPADQSNGYGETAIKVRKGQTIDGNNKVLEATGATGTWDTAISATGGTVKNVTVAKGFRGLFITHDNAHKEYCGKVIVENITIDGCTYTISCDQGTNNGLLAIDSTFNGWTSYAATLGNVVFNRCSFGKGGGYAFCRPYAPTEFNGCVFEAGYEIDARAKITFTNCTLDGVPLTADNLATLVTDNIANATVK